jgi:aminoglycoside 3-N-acetyltransferase
MSSVGKGDIVDGLRNLGVRPGDKLLVHSSLSSFGHVEGGAEAVIDALIEAVSPGGTVLVPTLTGDETLCPANPPIFDPRPSENGQTPCEACIPPTRLPPSGRTRSG